MCFPGHFTFPYKHLVERCQFTAILHLERGGHGTFYEDWDAGTSRAFQIVREFVDCLQRDEVGGLVRVWVYNGGNQSRFIILCQTTTTDHNTTGRAGGRRGNRRTAAPDAHADARGRRLVTARSEAGRVSVHAGAADDDAL